MLDNESPHWSICPKCQGRGKISKRLRKKVKLQYQMELAQFNKANCGGDPPVRPKGHLDVCPECKGSGLVYSALAPSPDTENHPHIAIIGAGIGGVALAVACLHRSIPFTLYERDSGFDERSQGYGLTLQQASKAIEGLGVFSLNEGVISTKHVVYTTDGKVIGEWGVRNLDESAKKSANRTNVHIARQALRLALLEQLGGHDKVEWGHQLLDFKESNSGDMTLSFQVGDHIKRANAGLVVGADGIRSAVRNVLIGEQASPLNYLGCIVILGICPLDNIKGIDSALLDSATVFQTANGHERIYMMPYSSNAIMWQLSFPMSEKDALALSAQGAKALKREACRRCQWHEPIPQVLAATMEAQVSGYPVYDRVLLEPALLAKGDKVTLIGDAAHPMSPFKGQGANQALLDALSLARGMSKGCGAYSKWKTDGIRSCVLTEFETEMLQRSAKKVKDSADAAHFLHSDVALHESNEPRGMCLKKKG